MRPLNTLIVLLLLVLVGGYVYFFASHETTVEAPKLFKIKQDDITTITLKYPDREIELGKRNGKWTILKPIEAAADQATVENIAHAVANCEVKKTIEEKPANLEPFGLAKPEVIVTVGTKDKGALPGIELGKTTPVGFAAYIKTTDKPAVMLTASAFAPTMKKTVDELRDRELVNFRADDANRVTLEREDGGTTEVDKDQGEWRIAKPAKYLADQSAVSQLLNSLLNARVDEFVNDSPLQLSQFGLDKPRLTVSVFTGKEGARQSLLFGTNESAGGKDSVYVRRGERAPVYSVHGWVFADVNKTTNDLRDKTMWTFDPSRIVQVKVDTLPKSFTLELPAGGKWQLAEAGKGKVPAEASSVERFLDQLHALKGKSIVEDPMSDPKKFGLNAPTQAVTLIAKDGKPVGTLTIAKVARRNETSGGGTEAARTDYYAHSTTSPAVYELTDSDYEGIRPVASQFHVEGLETPTPAPTATPSAAKAAATTAAKPAATAANPAPTR